jgi:hypothetical protein
MATITSAATGNWSNTATWVGGVVPTTVDDVVIGAGHTVTLDVNATILTLTGAANTASNLAITTSRTFTCTAANGITQKSISNSTAGLVEISGVGITVNINANIRNINDSLSSSAIRIVSICTVNIVGNVTNTAPRSASSATITPTISISAGATVNILGDVICNPATVGAINFVCILANNNATINITGNLSSGILTTGQNAILNNTTAITINVTGNVTANLATVINSNQSSTITVVGTITASNSAVGINMSSGNITISTPCLNATNGVMAVLSPNVKIYSSAIASWRFLTDIPATNKFLYSAGVALGNPVIANVRDGTVYGASNELTGSLIMAVPSDVRKSVPTDATVGTADLTAQDIFTEIANSSDPIAVRLRNIATVQTTGAQLASYN